MIFKHNFDGVIQYVPSQLFSTDEALHILYQIDSNTGADNSSKHQKKVTTHLNRTMVLSIS